MTTKSADIVLEDHVPYDRSAIWRIHDAYFAERGSKAWTEGEIPFYATSNYAIARQHARAIIALVRVLEEEGAVRPDETVCLLEVGAGLGRFAANFFRALQTGTGEAGRALMPRVRFVMTDYSARTVAESVAESPARELVKAGVLIPGVLDMRKPLELKTLEGKKIDARFAAVFANYVFCVSPLKVLRKTKKGFEEQTIRLLAKSGEKKPNPKKMLQALVGDSTRPDLMKSIVIDRGWAPVALDEILAPLHADTARAVLDPFEEATATYPLSFLEFLDQTRERMLPGGVALVTDYGTIERSDLEGLNDLRPAHYGNTVNHPINFHVLDAFARRAGLALVRTKNPFSVVFTAALRYAPEVGERFARSFKRIYVRDEGGQDLVELRNAAQLYQQNGEVVSAARVLRRCIKLDPLATEHHFGLALLCAARGWYRRALRHLRVADELDKEKAYDVAFQMGRSYTALKKFKRARKAFERALAQEDHPVTHANLAFVLFELGDKAAAYEHYRRSIELDSTSELARHVMLKVIEDFPPALAASS